MNKNGQTPLSLIKGSPIAAVPGGLLPRQRHSVPLVSQDLEFRVSANRSRTNASAEIIDLLQQHGARDDLMRLASILTSRPGTIPKPPGSGKAPMPGITTRSWN